MQDNTSVADPLRIVCDWVQYRWQRNLWVYLLLDDVMHAFGSVVHETLRSILLAVGVHPIHVHLIIFAAVHLRLFMGGFHGLHAFSALYEAGVGQGDLVSALLFCLVNAIRVAMVVNVVGMIDIPDPHSSASNTMLGPFAISPGNKWAWN